jgi:hypothetical protein
MAFSATVRGQTYNGPFHRTIWGEWTGSAGDAAGSFVVAGNVFRADFVKYDPLDQTTQIHARVGISQTGAISTLTIENQDTVTAGHFFIDVLGC